MLLRRRRVLLAKIETTVGTAIALAAADGAFNAFDTKIVPGIEFHARDPQGNFSPITGITGARMGTLTFRTDLVPGSAAHPSWASTLLPACGFVATANTYAPVTAPPGTAAGVKTLTMGVHQDGKFKSLRGAMGTFKIMLESGKPVMFDWTFSGVWVEPTDVTIVTPTRPAILPLRYMNAVQTIGLWSPKLKTFEIDAGNTVIMREDATSTAGFISAVITNRVPTGSLDPESELVATKNIYGEWLSHTEQALSIALSEGGIGLTIAAPKLQFSNIQESERSDLQTDDITCQFNRSADTADDELTLSFDIAA